MLTIATGAQIITSLRGGELYKQLQGRLIGVVDVTGFSHIGASQDDLDFFASCGFMQGNLGSDLLRYPFTFSSDGYLRASMGGTVTAVIDESTLATAANQVIADGYLNTVATNSTTANSLLTTADGYLNTVATNSTTANSLLTTADGYLNTISTTLTSGNQKTQMVDGSGHVMPAGDGYSRAIFEQISDGSNGPVAVETAGSDGVSNTANALVVKARLKGYNGTTWDRIRSGITTVTNSFVGWLNMMPWAIYNATPSTRADGYGGPLQANNSGSLLIADALIDPPGTGTAVTISDSTVVAYSSIYVGTGGDVYLSFKNGGSLIKLASVPSGTFIYSQIIRVGASTTATNIVGFSA